MATNPADAASPALTERLFVLLQHLLPQHLLSAIMYRLTRCDWPPLKKALIASAVRHYRVDLSEAEHPNPLTYPTFNAFFTRALRPGTRLLAPAPGLIRCPVDGRISQLGRIDAGTLFQAKGHHFSVEALLGGARSWTKEFAQGHFATLYLSPRDYHRVHMPYAGTLRTMIHVPGRLFSVNPATTRLVPSLFARNERVVCLFETALGPMALVLVGAIFVSSIDTVWAGPVTPSARRVSTWTYGETPTPEIHLAQGAEMGRFNMGSTLVLLLSGDRVDWAEGLVSGQGVRMGDPIGRVHPLGE